MNMKSLIIRAASVVILIMTSVFSGFAQTRSIKHDFSPFDAVEASDDFKVSTTACDNYGVKITVDDALESYVECYVRSGVLHIGLDDKNIPKDIRRQYKGRNSGDPTLVAVVYMPTLKSLTLNDDSEFINSSNLSGDNFTLTMSGGSRIADLKVVARTVSINISKNAKLSNANVTTEGDLSLSTDGKSVVTMNCAAENLAFSAAGSSEINLTGNIEKKVTATIASSSKTTLSGAAETLDINGKGISSKVDASGFKVSDSVLSISGAEVKVSASNSIELDLGKGAEVSYSGDPTVKIVKIQNASVLRP